jgi:serine/threonine protein kinase
MDVRGEITYKRIKEIGFGKGLNSTVWLANDPQLGGQIAVKEIEKQRIQNAAKYFDEAHVMFKVGHKNVVPILCAFQTSDLICLAMRYYTHGSLGDLTEKGPLNPKEVLRIGQSVLAGLASIHVNGFIHFDLKPSNVLFDNNRQPMVSDFGQTCSAGPGGLAVHPGMYMHAIPPECFSGVGGVQSDVYQMGGTLYRALNGDRFFDRQRGDDATLEARTTAGVFPDRRFFLPHVPKALKTVIRKAMMVNPADRYQSATDMANALARVSVGLDWSVSLSPSAIEWIATPKGKGRLRVVMSQSGSKWNVEAFRRASKEQRFMPNSLWQKGLNETQAFKHLKAFFETAA